MKLVALGEVCTLINGGTPDTKNSKFWDGKHAWITPAEMGNLKSPFLGTSRRTLTDEGMRNSSAQLLPKYSVIMSSRAPIGHLVINEIPMASNQGCKGLIPNETLNFKYLYYFLYANKEYLNELGSGTTFAEISGSKLKTVLIPVPSLEKQREIVEKLDSAFAEIDLLEKNLGLGDEKANQILMSLLSAEFSFTSEENSNNSSARERDDIAVLPLKEFCKMYQPPTISTKEMIPDGKYVVFGANGPIGRYNKYNHEKPQLLVTCRGATCGAVNMSEPFAWINGNAMVVQPDLEKANLEYIKYAFLGGIDVSSAITGSAQPQITRTTLEVIQVPLPSLEKQEVIVEKLNGAFAEIDLIKEQIKKQKDYATALRQSLLSGAFTVEEAVA